jgi:UDP-glucose 4-epimerase
MPGHWKTKSLAKPGTILITGGAGYIGSHTLRVLLDEGRSVVVLDDLSTGDRRVVPESVPFFNGDAGDAEVLARIHRAHPFDSVVHFAAKTSVEESVREPALYYRENSAKTLALIEACRKLGVKHFVYSSTCAVYGSGTERVDEKSAVAPESPYGWSKLFSERMLTDISARSELRYAILRYFNVGGAWPSAGLGPHPTTLKSLVKLCAEAAAGKLSEIRIHGEDYSTPDGTGRRDYIHVVDLASAHAEVLRRLESGGSSEVFNCGYGRPHSVKEVIRAMEKVSGKKLPAVPGPRRAGDIESIYAVSDKLRTETHWSPRHDELEEICRSAYEWEMR